MTIANAMQMPQSRAQYRRDPDVFVATRTGGGGFIKFAGHFRNWKWIAKNCKCAACGVPVTYRRSSVPCDGMVRGAVYFECEGADHHVIRREDDLRWRIGAQARDEKLRAQGKIADVKEAYYWLTAVPDPEAEDEIVPF